MDIQYIAGLVADKVLHSSSYKLQSYKRIDTPSSLVSRLELVTAGSVKVLFVKIPSKNVPNRDRYIQRLRREYALAGRINNAFQANPEMSTVSPAGFIDEIDGLVTWEVKGESLQDLISAGLRFKYRHASSELVKLTELSALWLRQLHSLDLVEPSAGLTEDITSYYTGRLDALVRNKHSKISQTLAASLKQKISNWIDEALSENDAKFVLCHNDFSPHNIVVTDKGISVLDFSFSTAGLPAFDLACFWHKIEDLKGSLLRGNRALTEIQERFLEVYGANFDAQKPDIKLGLARLVLSKMLTLLNNGKASIRGRIDDRRRYSNYLALLESDFDSPIMMSKNNRA